MKILSALRKKKEPRDFYIALILKPHKAAAILFEKTASNLVILSTKEESLHGELDSLKGEELIKVSDTVISSIEGALPEGEMVEKTIFSVPYSWQKEGKITRENLEKLKEVCDALELKAIGFIVSIEATVNFMQKKDGAPITAIFVEHVTDKVFVYLVKAGAIIEAVSADVEHSVVKTVEKLLAGLTNTEVLPAKIFLHDYENGEEVQQEFLSHEWKDSLSFLHVPQVLILEKGIENEAVINGVASQMGFDVLHDIKAGSEVVDNEDELSDEETAELASAEEFGFAAAGAGAAPIAVSGMADDPDLIGDDGGQNTEDGDQMTDESENEPGDPTTDKESEDEAVVDDQLESSFAQEEGTKNNEDEEESGEDTEDDKPEAKYTEESNIREPEIKDPFKKDLESFAKAGDDEKEYGDTVMDEPADTVPDTRVTLADKLRTTAPFSLVFALLNSKKRGAVLKKGLSIKVIPGVIVFVALIAGASYVYFNLFLKAEVIVFADSKVISKDEKVTFAQDKNTSFEDSVIKLNTIEERVDASASKDATGTKETGDKATGEVTVYNKTEKPVTFNKGTTISSSNGLDFVINDDIKIASTSSFSTSFSSTKVKVQASKFGKEYNLPSNTNFTVDGASTSNYFAKNDSAFSGGSKKELTVVSAKDIAAVEDSATAGTEDKATKSALGKIGGDTLLVKTPLSSDMEDEKLSAKEGAEAKSVTLSGTVVYTFGTYSKDDLSEFVKQMAKDEVPSDYNYIDNESEVQVNNLKVEEGEASGTLKINSVFAPTIQQSQLLGQVRAKKLTEAEQTVKNIKGVSDYKIIRRNVLPLFPALMPFNPNNITITVKTNG